MSTQLSNPSTYDVSNMIFGKAISGSATSVGNGPAIKYYRIPVSTRNEDGSFGDLVFQTEELFSFGLSTNTDQQTGKIIGYTFPLCMWNKDCPTETEKAFSTVLESVVEKCKDHLCLDTTKTEIKKFSLKRDALDSLSNFMYWKRDPETGKVLQDKGPVIYPKLIERKRDKSGNPLNEILTSMFDENGNDIDPMSLAKKYCWVKAAIKVESIYVGAKISLQVKVLEAQVRLAESSSRRLLQRPKSESRMTVETVSVIPLVEKTNAFNIIEEEESEDDEQIQDSEEVKPPLPVVETPARKPARRIVTKKA